MAAVFLFEARGPAFEASTGLSQAHAESVRLCWAGAGEARNHPFLAEDTRTAALLAEHPLVTGPLQLRFCASAPMLAANGSAVGAVCVFDDKPRRLTQPQGAALGMLARQAAALFDAEIERQTITQRLEEMQKQLDTLARNDALTGLPNRRFFEERVQEAIARTRRRQEPIGVMYLDLDRFDSINDSLGRAGGDAVLQEFARRLRASLRETDIAARYAGDEFMVLLEDVADEWAAERVATKILQAMNPVFRVAGHPLAVTTSIGVALHCGDAEDLETLLSRADLALFSAKKEGRNRVKVAASLVG
jgi:diguanylate cyclase (GGDEF)-like protein